MSSAGDNSIKHWIFDNMDGSSRLLRSVCGHRAPPNCVKFYKEVRNHWLRGCLLTRIEIENHAITGQFFSPIFRKFPLQTSLGVSIESFCDQGFRILSAGQDHAFWMFSMVHQQRGVELSQGHMGRKSKRLKTSESELKLGRVLQIDACEVCLCTEPQKPGSAYMIIAHCWWLLGFRWGKEIGLMQSLLTLEIIELTHGNWETRQLESMCLHCLRTKKGVVQEM